VIKPLFPPYGNAEINLSKFISALPFMVKIAKPMICQLRKIKKLRITFLTGYKMLEKS